VRNDEPFERLLTQGMVLNHIYSRTGPQGGVEYFRPDEVEMATGSSEARLRHDDSPVTYEGLGTMSKSKNNGVDPQELIDRYGADTARLFVMFASPPEQTVEWNDAGVEGANRFLRRVWSFGARQEAVLRGSPEFPHGAPLGPDAKALRRELHTVLRQVTYDYERMQYNTVVSGAMKMLNALEAAKDDAAPGMASALREGYSILLRVLYPACPHTTWVLWRDLGYAGALGDLLDAPWPAVDAQALVQDEVELMLQVNGKLRGSIRVPAGASEREIEAAAIASPAFQRFGEGRAIRMVKVVPGRLVNIVV